MQLEHEFTVPVPMAQAWDVLLDVERIAPCMPGATVESFDGETIEGRVKVKVGPIQVTYAGTARFVEKDEGTRRAVIDASAKESRGVGTAKATITARLHDEGGSATRVTVTTDLAITGKPAQFGRGVMAEVGNKILGRFADCLAGELGGNGGAGAATDAGMSPGAPVSPGTPSTASAGVSVNSAAAFGSATPSAQAVTGAETAAAGGIAAATSVGTPPQARPGPAMKPLRPVAEGEAIDLLDAAGMPVLRRLAPLVGGALLLLLLWRLLVRPRG